MERNITETFFLIYESPDNGCEKVLKNNQSPVAFVSSHEAMNRGQELVNAGEAVSCSVINRTAMIAAGVKWIERKIKL